MQTNIKVSFDFDATLDHKEVQQFAKELISQGIDVHICTYRFSDYEMSEQYKEHVIRTWPGAYAVIGYGGDYITTYNGDLFKIAKELGIPAHNIHFTNYENKDKFFTANPEFLWHLDDNEEQIEAVSKTKVDAVMYPGGMWKEYCIGLINNALGNYRV